MTSVDYKTGVFDSEDIENKLYNYALKNLEKLRNEIEEIIKAKVGEAPNFFAVSITYNVSDPKIYGALEGYKCREYLEKFENLIVDLQPSFLSLVSIGKRLEKLRIYTKSIETGEEKLPELIKPLQEWNKNNFYKLETLYRRDRKQFDVLFSEYYDGVVPPFYECLKNYELELKEFYANALEFLSMFQELIPDTKKEIEAKQANFSKTTEKLEVSEVMQEGSEIIQIVEGFPKETEPIRRRMKEISDMINIMPIASVTEMLKSLANDLYGNPFKNKDLGDELLKISTDLEALPPQKSLKDRDVNTYELMILSCMITVEEFLKNYEMHVKKIEKRS